MWRQRGKWPQMKRSPWTQERAVLSPGCRRARFLPKSDPAAPFFVLHRPAQRMRVMGVGDKVLCACLRPRSVLQGCHEGVMTVLPARCEGARWVSARCCQRCQGRNSVSACRHGAVSVTIACHNGARYVLVRRSLQHELCAVMVPSTSRYGAAWVLDASYLGAVCVLLGCCESAEPPRRQHPTALKALTPASRKSR